jgi:hypothetical protein
VVPAPPVLADLAAAAALAVADEYRSGAGLQVVLGQSERLVDAQVRAPEQHDQGSQAGAVDAVAGLAHDRDDLLHRGRIGRVAQPLVARRAPGEVAGRAGGRAAAAGGIQQRRRGHGSSSVDDLIPAKSTVPGAQPAVSRARRLGDTGRPPVAPPHNEHSRPPSRSRRNRSITRRHETERRGRQRHSFVAEGSRRSGRARPVGAEAEARKALLDDLRKIEAEPFETVSPAGISVFELDNDDTAANTSRTTP